MPPLSLHRSVPSASPYIRSPSLSHPSTRPRNTRPPLTPPLPPSLLTLLKLFLVLLVVYSEWGVFRVSSRGFLGIGGCKWDDSPSLRGQVYDGQGGWIPDTRWQDARKAHGPEGDPFHVLVAADPQILDMKSYPGRSWGLRRLGVWITDLYARKSWKAAMMSRGSGGGKTEAVVWLGDLMDSGVEVGDEEEYTSLLRRFRSLFPLPRLTSLPLSPPIPSITLPGNHDLGLHVPSASLSSYYRERFSEAFGPLYGEREWKGWRVVWIDSMALLEEGFWQGGGGIWSEMRAWLEGMKGADRTIPTILLTHIPLFRPEGTACGRERESSRPIHQGVGRNYQNELGERETKWLVDKVGPTLVYSGDDHDACTIHHERYTSPLDESTPVVEVTVKAFSMAMGVSSPGYHLLSLYPPLPPASSPASPSSDSLSYTYTQTSCLLPSQLSIYLHIYAPLFTSFFLFFFLPKAFVALYTFFTSPRRSQRHSSGRSRRSAAALANGVPLHERKASLLSGGGAGSRRMSVEQEIADEEAGQMSYPGLFGGVSHHHYDASPGSATLFDASASFSASEDEEEDANGPGLPTANGVAGGRSGKNGHVRRVSRVWLWEGGGRSRSSSSASQKIPSTASLPIPLPTAVTDLLDSIIARLAANSLVAPLARLVLRPIFRLVRGVWRKAAAPFAFLAAGVRGLEGRGGPVGQVIGETLESLYEVAWAPVACWIGVAVLWSL
ncbi:hypothetical protein JCM11641_004582 [Rhodosporidiobolus odoratus]